MFLLSIAKIEEDEEEEPLVKRATKKVAVSESEEDMPLANLLQKKSGPSSNMVNVVGSVKGPQIRHSSRASKPNQRYEETESESEKISRQRKSNKRPRRLSGSENRHNRGRPGRPPGRKSKASSSSKSNRRRLNKRQRRSESTGKAIFQFKISLLNANLRSE